MKIGPFALILLVAGAVPSRAQRKDPVECAGKTQLALDDCAAKRAAAADAELSMLYRKLAREDSGPTLRLLRESQRTWTRFRDAHCRWITAQWEGGTIQPMYTSLCMERVARDRVAQLRADAADLSGGGRRDYPR